MNQTPFDQMMDAQGPEQLVQVDEGHYEGTIDYRKRELESIWTRTKKIVLTISTLGSISIMAGGVYALHKIDSSNKAILSEYNTGKKDLTFINVDPPGSMITANEIRNATITSGVAYRTDGTVANDAVELQVLRPTVKIHAFFERPQDLESKEYPNLRPAIEKAAKQFVVPAK